MDDKLAAAIAAAPAKVLTEIVKLAQRQGRKGTKGSWKEFLNVYDKKFGSSLSDPGKRPKEALASFLQTFSGEDDSKFVDNVLKSHSSREVLLQIAKEASGDVSPEQRLVHLTLEHPLFMAKYVFPSYEKDWVVTKPCKMSKLVKSDEMLALDCEMVLCEDGTDALVRVCVVDRDLQVKLHEKVNPYKPVADYRTEITGIHPGDLDNVTCSLRDIQKSLKKLLSKGSILVGHGLHNDLLALKLDHARIIDTSLIYKNSVGRVPSLSNLCESILGYKLREEGAPHNCLDDARTAMKIVLAKLKHGVDKETPLLVSNLKSVPDDELARLLVHKIPSAVPTEELRRVFPANFTIELKPLKKGQGKHYSVLAIFKKLREAHEAFQKVDGSIEKDSAGRPQKLVTLVSDSGKTTTVCVRQMVPEDSLQDQQQKRALELEDRGGQKKQKTDQSSEDGHLLEEIERLKQELRVQGEAHLKETERLKQELEEKDVKNHCDDHLKEMEKLKQHIRAKDLEIATQDKIIADLKQKLNDAKTTKKGR
ncbi:unnamed protein product [Linum trigynum]|uniref:Exonuclease domain-containing protein n=1 Tax=Linum trigynum TaxID=586398 RepID=A0AAV2DDY8_9ROSI